MKMSIRSRKISGFTLIEMVGVLAVIAILAALLVPKIFAAINDSRYSNAVASINSVKTATMDYFGKNGSFARTLTFDTVLVSSNHLERPLACKLAETSASAQVVALAAAAAVGNLDGKGGNYTLDNLSTLTGDSVVQIKLEGVALNDARELSNRIDGPTLSTAAGADTLGRVVYENLPATTVFIYIAHK